MPEKRQVGSNSEISFEESAKGPESEKSYATSKTNYSGHVTATVDIARNPLCPPIRGLCCLIILFNLAILLICLGFIVVCQLNDIPFAYGVAVFILIFGFITLVGCFIYCFLICSKYKEKKAIEGDELRWTHQWKKTAHFGKNDNEINYSNDVTQDYPI